jgi:hypothetical protein
MILFCKPRTAVKLGIYDTYITEYVIAEINQTTDNEERLRL